ncbi:MAG: hypothetical protein RH942_18545 [Kiloniellaceae bacterium]
MGVRKFFLAVLMVLFFAPGSAGAADEKRDSDQSEDRDGKSRNETGQLNHIPVVGEGGTLRINRIVIIQSRFIHIANTDAGVDFDSLDKADVSDIPLLGSVFGPSVTADDLTDETRVGAVYTAGDNTLAVVVSDDVDVGKTKVSVVNGKGRFEIRVEPRLIEVNSLDLGSFGHVESVREVLTGAAQPETTTMLAGLNPSATEETESKVPWMSDVPLLGTLFKGTTHKKERNLMVFIRPSIVAGDES